MKFSDLSSVFELFIFSDIFEVNRDILVEGNSLMITLMKNYSDENRSQKKINVKKIISLKEVLNKPINELEIQFNDIEELNKITSLSKIDGKTKITINIKNKTQTFKFILNENRKIDRNLIKSLKIEENIT